jgi:hypothetical protein
MPIPLPLALGGGGILLGLGWLLFGSSSSTPAGPRGPYTTDVPIPPNGITWEQVDAAMCLAYEAGANTGQELIAGVLSRLWPDVPWPAQVGDAHSVRTVQDLVGGRASQFVQRVQAGQPVCGGIEPPPPPPTADVTDITPWVTGEAGAFSKTLHTGSNPTLVVRAAYGLGASEGGRINSALSCMVTTGFNLLFYSRPRDGADYGRAQLPAMDGHPAKYYDIGMAWDPANQDVQSAALTKTKLLRQISWSGAALKNLSRGLPWLPPMTRSGNALVCSAGGTWDAARNPPPEVLAALGWPGGIAEMKAAWDTRPMTG